MARGTWDDFTSKYGFADGETTEDRDFEARDALCQLLNETPAFQRDKVKAIGFDRDGMHNGCMILLLPAMEGKSDEEILASALSGEMKECPLPEIEDEMYDLICQAYEGNDGGD